MANVLKIDGLDDIMRKFKQHELKLGKQFENALVRAGLTLQALSQQIVPVQFGVLKASAFTRNLRPGEGWRSDVVVGYTANYAVYVHENLEAAHGKAFNIKHAAAIEAAAVDGRNTVASGLFYRGENQQAKFLERPAREARALLIQTIRAGMKR